MGKRICGTDRAEWKQPPERRGRWRILEAGVGLEMRERRNTNKIVGEILVLEKRTWQRVRRKL